tara:strand:+ start:1130 stop:1303 length:174 start_codon:yes stop_codon:yes gene_type:complete
MNWHKKIYTNYNLDYKEIEDIEEFTILNKKLGISIFDSLKFIDRLDLFKYFFSFISS